LFDPSEHGLTPRPRSTACHRGFFCAYAIDDERLVLRDLFISLGIDPESSSADQDSPLLFGKYPVYSSDECCHAYRSLNAPISFTGGVLLGEGFIQDLYVHMGFQAPHTYRTVHELIFERGLLTEQQDLSDEMARIRQEQCRTEDEPCGEAPPPPGGRKGEDLVRWIQSTFDRMDK